MVDYFVGPALYRETAPGRRKRLLLVSLSANLGILGFFKYFNFFVDSAVVLLSGLGLNPNEPVLNVVLPVGISFYTFQTMSYTIDIYRGRLEPTRNFLDFALFVSFFPQLVAGPIERASVLLPQIARPRRLTRQLVLTGLNLMLLGYFKKVFIADTMAPLVSRAFAAHRAVEAINAANAGYNANNYRTAYERWAEELDPDLVVVGFVPDREYRSDPAGTRYVVQDGLVTGRFRPGQTPRQARTNPLRSIRKFLARNSHFYVLLRNFFYYNDKVGSLLGKGADGDSARRALRAYQKPVPEGVQKGWQRTDEHLTRLAESVRADGRELLIAAIPTVDAVDDPHREMLRLQAGFAEDEIDPQLPLRRLRGFCKEAGIPLVDMTPAVREAARERSVFLFDNHWNGNGIAVGAEALARQLQRSGLPPFAPMSGR